jgi:hypothetical protein
VPSSKRLWAEYDDASAKAAAGMGKWDADPSSRANTLKEDQRAGAAIKRIRQIYGDEATPPIAPSGFTIK